MQLYWSALREHGTAQKGRSRLAAGRKKQLGVDGRLGSLPCSDTVPGRACLAPPRTTLP